MGGGGAVMKATAKAAGIGVVNGGFRQIPAENPVRSAARQVPAVFSSTGDDWDLVGKDEKLPEHMPRLLFGGAAAPTIQEAKDATSELKDAIDNAYLSSPSVPGRGLSFITKPLNAKIIDRITNDGAPIVPKNALKAFTLLSRNPAAQTVVASIACDPNVWSAVLKNDALVEFLQSNAIVENSESNSDFVFHSSRMDQSSVYGEVLKKSVQNIKIKVLDMVTNLSDYFNDLFAIPIEEQSSKSVEKDGDSVAPVDVAKLMGLVIMVIAIIFLKRG